MTERMVKHLSYNEKGNEVYFSIENSPMSPKITVKNLKIKTFKKDEQIFVDNEKSKKISFLINGCINCLLSDKTKIKYLPKDIFVPLYKISSGKICFTAESESKMLIVNNALIKSFKTNNAFNCCLNAYRRTIKTIKHLLILYKRHF